MLSRNSTLCSIKCANTEERCETMQLIFYLEHQTLTMERPQKIIASHSQNYLTAKFVPLSDDWSGVVTVLFGAYQVVLDENWECVIPWEVLQQEGWVEVSAFCGDLHTSIKERFYVMDSGYRPGQTPQPPTPSVYLLLTGMAQTALDTANGVKQRADSGEFNGKDGAPGPMGPEGPKGQDGTVSFDALSEEQRESLRGKSAYAYAQDGGYTGTEEEFARKMATEPPSFADLRAAAPHNLFDNSDFSNPVNQRGVTNQSETGKVFIDRWIFDGEGESKGYHLSSNGIAFGAGSCLKQKLPLSKTRLHNKQLTLIVWLADDTVWLQSFTAMAEESYTASPWDKQGIGSCFDGECWLISLANLPNCTIKHVGLFDGGYREDTLPLYHPKGYGAELNECMRYYIKTGTLYLPGVNNSASASFVWQFPTRMRIPPTISCSGTPYIYTPGNGAALAVLHSASPSSTSATLNFKSVSDSLFCCSLADIVLEASADL